MAEIRFPVEWLDLVQSGQLEPVELTTLCAILEHDWTSQGKGKGYIKGYTSLAERINKSRRQTIRICQKLAEKGYIKIIPQGKKGNILLVTLMTLASDTHDTSVVTPMTPGGDTHDTSIGDTHVTQKHLREASKEATKEKHKSPRSLSSFRKYTSKDFDADPQDVALIDKEIEQMRSSFSSLSKKDRDKLVDVRKYTRVADSRRY